MKNLVSFALWFLAGYVAVTKAAPYVQAKIESANPRRDVGRLQ